MAERRCECCDLPLDQCGRAAERAHARERKALYQQALATPGVIPAAYPGVCPGCREPYPEGAPIRKGPDGWHGVMCCLPLDV